ncbi:FAD/NAD(P)-binding domain-containing protein [Xylariaceae sp. FL0594]|nr:FAD/NAD(P)-binding domain-containing protein [Xylariaceae sp. FL0594]
MKSSCLARRSKNIAMAVRRPTFSRGAIIAAEIWNRFGGPRLASTVTDTVPTTKDTQSTTGRRERVVILGSGWAGYGLARSLDPKKYERIIISPRSYFVFTPLVASTAVGTLEFRTAIESVRRLKIDQYHQGWADDIDFARKVVRVEANTTDDLSSRTTAQLLPRRDSHRREDEALEKGVLFDVPYDKLVIAVGAYSQTFGIEGVKEHAHFLRNVGDARRVRMKLLQCFEKAALPITSDEDRRKLLHFAIVGGGPTGIEFAAELHDLVEEDLSKTYPGLRQFVKITVYDVAPKVLPMFDQKLAQYAMDTFRREKIEVKTEHHLQRIRRDDAEASAGTLKLKIKEYGDEEVDAGMVVWSTGLMQNPLLERLASKTLTQIAPTGEAIEGRATRLNKDKRTGGLVTDGRLRVTTVPAATQPGDIHGTDGAVGILPDVFSMGDCTIVESGPRLPATAQVASQQAKYLAKQLNKGITADTPPFRFRNWGTMTYLGSWTAIHQSGADELTGKAAWFLWRTAYLTRSMSIRNKIMVPIYWFISWVFGRDISRF